MLAHHELLAWFGPVDAVARYERFVSGEEPDEHRSVRRWARGGTPGHPELEVLVADRQDASFRVAHETWGYPIRAIARAAGLSHTAVRNRIARARAGVSEGPGPLETPGTSHRRNARHSGRD
jgi:hypothetical protein